MASEVLIARAIDNPNATSISKSMRDIRATMTNAQFQSELAKPESEKRWGRKACILRAKAMNVERDRLAQTCCSSRWIEDNWSGCWMIIERTRRVHRSTRVIRSTKLAFVSAPYPPGGAKTKMLRCKNGDDRRHPCFGRLFPPQFVTSAGYCLTCFYADLADRKIIHEMHDAGILASRRTGALIDQRVARREQAAGRDYQGGAA